MERGLRAKMNILDDYALPDELDLTLLKDIETPEALKYLAIIYKNVPEVRADIIKGLLEIAVESFVRS